MVSFEHLCCQECLVDTLAGVVPLPARQKKIYFATLLLADADVYSAGGVCVCVFFFSGYALLAEASEEVVTKIAITVVK